MPAVLTHKTIMLLARERLADIKDTLKAKIRAGVTVTDLEHRMAYLAEKAHDLMSESTVGLPAPPPNIDRPVLANRSEPLGQGVSRFAVMGSMGPDITAFSAMLAPNQGWVFDTIHKGTPDSDRELVVARTTDFVRELWTQVSRAIDAGPGTAAVKDNHRAAMRGYVLGHLCHIAGDVISHPYINDLEWHLVTRSHEKFSHEGGEGSIDAAVARQVLRRESTREGQNWSVWWPTPEEVPASFFDAYSEALQTVYRARSSRPTGFGHFEDEVQRHGTPDPDAAFVRDGYRTYRSGALTFGYDWGRWSWFGFLTPMIVPLAAAIPLAFAMPHARKLFEEPEPGTSPDLVDYECERGFFEALTLPMAMTAIVPLFYGGWLAGITTHSAGGLFGFGLTLSSLSGIAAVVFFATLGSSRSADLPAGVRWGVLFGLPAAQGVIFSVLAIAYAAQGKSVRWKVALLFTAPLLLGLVFGGIFLLLKRADRGGIAYGVVGGIIALTLLVSWFTWIPVRLRDVRVPEEPEAFPTTRPHFVRLFDDATLGQSADKTRPVLADRIYPSGRRALLKLWWEGTGDLYVRPRRTHLEFSRTGEGEPVQVVPSPIEPMTAAEYAEVLERVVQEEGGATGKLHGAVSFPADAPIEVVLVPGATFADHGDLQDDAQSHDEHAEKWEKLGTTRDGSKYVLYHAPRNTQSVRFGRLGPEPFDTRELDGVEGAGKVRTAGTVVTGEGSAFRAFFAPGDLILINGNPRNVERVVSDTELHITLAFGPGLEVTTPTKYTRVISNRELADGYSYVSNPAHGVLGGEALMDYAADLAALLCLGVTPELLPTTDTTVASLTGRNAVGGAAVGTAVSRVQRVFRNWCLDRRRVNEWRMLVQGGALSEKDRPSDYGAPPGATDLLQVGDRVSRAHGWVPLLRRWLEVSGHVEQNGAAEVRTPGSRLDATNRELSRAVAFLFDMPDPVALA